jgi:hypothetical protein
MKEKNTYKTPSSTSFRALPIRLVAIICDSKPIAVCKSLKTRTPKNVLRKYGPPKMPANAYVLSLRP